MRGLKTLLHLMICEMLERLCRIRVVHQRVVGEDVVWMFSCMVLCSVRVYPQLPDHTPFNESIVVQQRRWAITQDLSLRQTVDIADSFLYCCIRHKEWHMAASEASVLAVCTRDCSSAAN